MSAEQANPLAATGNVLKSIPKDSSQKASKVWWINGAFVILAHLIGLLSLWFYRPDPKTWLMTLCLWQLANLG